MAIKGGR